YEENSVMIADGTGGAILVWNDDRNGDNDIFAQRIDADGTLLWASGGLAVCQASGDQDYPTAAVDGSGGAFIVWRDSRGGDIDIYVQRVDAGGNILLDTDGAGIVRGPADQRCPRIVKDGGGGAVIAWVDESGGDCDIYALVIDGTGAVCSGPGFLPVCSAEGDQDAIALAADCVGGAIVSWIDYRDSGTGEIRAFHLQATVTDAAEPLPDARISLGQNRPNPFNPVTVIPFVTSEPGRVVLKVFDTAGREVRTLLDEARPAGRYSTTWDGRDEAGSPVSSGFYYYRITFGAENVSRKMILLR
ncbi:MAG TPA: FlgD immunoglobulin-like domain containing protein, partial [Candidatus Krumholzibacterium sp.]|nr:FlgD immunoglobulin-like domain containing protein [Candidatus Krumholzibacterium sp.]